MPDVAIRVPSGLKRTSDSCSVPSQVARHFPARWLGYVAYRQLGWAWHALLERRLGAHLRGALAAVPLVPTTLRERRAAPPTPVPIEEAVPPRPISRAGGA